MELSFSSSFSLQASRSILRVSFSNSIGSVASVALVLDALFLFFADVNEEVATKTEDEEVATTEEEATAEEVTTAEEVATADELTGRSVPSKEEIGGPHQVNLGTGEILEVETRGALESEGTNGVAAVFSDGLEEPFAAGTAWAEDEEDAIEEVAGAEKTTFVGSVEPVADVNAAWVSVTEDGIEEVTGVEISRAIVLSGG